MKICVITPYFEANSAWLRQAHESVRAQTVPARHILVCDGSDHAELDDFEGSHIVLRRNFRDYGNTPRLIGCYQAISEGADAIAFLDADNWYHPDHLMELGAFAWANNLVACSSGRALHRADGTFMARCPIVNARPYIDTSCLLILKDAFPHLINWAINSQNVAAEVDQRVWQAMVAADVRLGFLDRASVCYRTRHAVHYELAGETPPIDAITRTDLGGEQYR